MTDAPELLPCPFCGGEEIGVSSASNNIIHYTCLTCEGSSGYVMGDTEEPEVWNEAVSLWNTRASKQALDAAREEGRREGLEEAAKAVEILKGQCVDPHVKIWAENRAEAIRALIDKPGDAYKEGE